MAMAQQPLFGQGRNPSPPPAHTPPFNQGCSAQPQAPPEAGAPLNHGPVPFTQPSYLKGLLWGKYWEGGREEGLRTTREKTSANKFHWMQKGWQKGAFLRHQAQRWHPH